MLLQRTKMKIKMILRLLTFTIILEIQLHILIAGIKNVDNKCYVQFYDVNPHDITQHCENLLKLAKSERLLKN